MRAPLSVVWLLACASMTAAAVAAAAQAAATYKGLEVVVSGVYDDKGSLSNTSGDHGGTTVKSKTGRGPADRSGRYTLDGFSIELHYDSGKTERRMFAISSDKNHVFVRLDGEMMPRR